MHTLLSFFSNPSYDILTQLYDICFNPESRESSYMHMAVGPSTGAWAK